MVRPAAEAPASAPTLEQAEVVVVGASLGLQERRAPEAQHDPEAEDLGVEGDAALDVADVQDGVVESLDGHGGLLDA